MQNLIATGEDSAVQPESLPGQSTPVEVPSSEGGAPEGQAPSDLDTLRQELNSALQQLQATRQEQDSYRQQQQGVEQQQRQAAFEQDVQQARQLYDLLAPGLDDGQAKLLKEILEYAPVGRLAARQDIRQTMDGWRQDASRLRDSEATWKLVEEHFGHQTTLARAREIHSELMGIQDAQARAKFAKLLASSTRDQNRRERAESEPRIEGGQRAPASPGSFDALERKFAYTPEQMTEAEMNRYLAGRAQRGL